MGGGEWRSKRQGEGNEQEYKETPGVGWNARGKRTPRPNLERGYINGH